MIKAGVIGHPVAHSLSPKLHGYWLKKYAIDGEYKAYDVVPASLASFIRALPEKGFAGCNLTIPHKEAIVEFLDEVDDLARIIGAVNTIVVEGSRLVGTNTDVAGFYENIKPHVKGTKKAVIFGAGGAARAVIMALTQLGFSDIVITNRTRERAEALASHHDLTLVEWDKKETALAGADVLVNTTSLGLAGNPPLELSLESLPKEALVTDIVYKPLITPLLTAAHARGNPIVDGLGMLLHQAAPGFAAWFGVMPEVTNELREFILAP